MSTSASTAAAPARPVALPYLAPVALVGDPKHYRAEPVDGDAQPEHGDARPEHQPGTVVYYLGSEHDHTRRGAVVIGARAGADGQLQQRVEFWGPQQQVQGPAVGRVNHACQAWFDADQLEQLSDLELRRDATPDGPGVVGYSVAAGQYAAHVGDTQ